LKFSFIEISTKFQRQDQHLGGGDLLFWVGGGTIALVTRRSFHHAKHRADSCAVGLLAMVTALAYWAS
jgi:hypothetical protein